MQSSTNVANHDIATPWWGLKPAAVPCFGARLVQEGNRLHYLADRASIRHLQRIRPAPSESGISTAVETT